VTRELKATGISEEVGQQTVKSLLPLPPGVKVELYIVIAQVTGGDYAFATNINNNEPSIRKELIFEAIRSLI
jgi:hypothetical protein